MLCSQLTNKLTIDLKSFCLFLLVSMTDSYSKKLSHHYIVAYRCTLYINRSPFPLCLSLFFPYATNCLPACLPALVSCFVSLFCFYISSLVLVAILLYIYTSISVPALVLPKRATLHPDPFVTLCCVTNRFRNTYTLRHSVCTIKYACTC